MSENQSNDNLSKLFQRAQQQAERSSQPPPMLWERLENKLEARPKRKPLSFLRFAAAASILMTLGMTGLLLMRSQKDLGKNLAAAEGKTQPDTIVTIVQSELHRDKTTTVIADASEIEKKAPNALQRIAQESYVTQDDIAPEMVSAPTPAAPYMSDNIAQYGEVAASKPATLRQEELNKDSYEDYAKTKISEDAILESESQSVPRPADQHVAGGPASNQATAANILSYPPQRGQTSKKESAEPTIELDKVPGVTVENEDVRLAQKNAARRTTAKRKSLPKSAYAGPLDKFSFLKGGTDEQGKVSESWEWLSSVKLRGSIQYKGMLSEEKIEIIQEKDEVYLSLQLKEKGNAKRLKLTNQTANRHIFEGEGLRITLVQGKTPTHTWEIQSLKGTLSKEQLDFFKKRGFEPDAGFKEQLSRCINRL